MVSMNRLVGTGLLVYFAYLFAVTMAPFDFQWSDSIIPRPSPSSDLSRYDFAANLLLFLPFGLLMRGLRAGRPFPFVVILLSAAGVSGAIEMVQSFLPARYASPHDIAINVVSAALGFFLADHALERGWADRMVRHHVKIAAIALFFYAALLLFIAVYPRIAPFYPANPLTRVFHWILRATPFRPFHPGAQDFVLFLTFWPIGVLLALSLGASSWARLALAVGWVGVWLWAMKTPRSSGVFMPFAWNGMQGTTVLALVVGILSGGYLHQRLSMRAPLPPERSVGPS